MASSAHPDRAAVEALLPHRDPFLFVDAVSDSGEGWCAVTWRVPEDLDCFRGHFPGNPVLPGVLIAEHCFQAAALAIYAGVDSKEDPGTPVLTRIEDARYRRVVRPGETLETRAEVVEQLGNARWCTATVRVNGQKAANLRYVLALAPVEPPAAPAPGAGGTP